MKFRILHSILATSLVTFVALPVVADDAGMTVPGRPATTLLPDDRDAPLPLLALVGPVVAISVLTILGLTITFRALRHDMRQRRIVYRQRGHGTARTR